METWIYQSIGVCALFGAAWLMLRIPKTKRQRKPVVEASTEVEELRAIRREARLQNIISLTKQ